MKPLTPNGLQPRGLPPEWQIRLIDIFNFVQASGYQIALHERGFRDSDSGSPWKTPEVLFLYVTIDSRESGRKRLVLHNLYWPNAASTLHMGRFHRLTIPFTVQEADIDSRLFTEELLERLDKVIEDAV